jgi:hypothetical protein
MHIANPIYDVVFKYLMEDSKIAKLLIGSIIDEEIIGLDFLPQEQTIKLEKNSLTVYRVDFRAQLKTPDGFKCVLIEIQKAKFSTDIMRFRRYLGSQYSDKENSYTVVVDEQNKTDQNKAGLKKALPIVSIYFLGYPLEGLDAPVIQVKRHYYDVIDEHKEIKTTAEFIESLTHDSFVIQIPHLHKKIRNDLECLLSIFDQHNRTQDHHILNVEQSSFPEKYQMIVRKLQRAIAEPEIREVMDVEDDFLEELQDKERLIARKDQQIKDKDKELKDNKKELEDKANRLKEQENLIKELMQKIKKSG